MVLHRKYIIRIVPALLVGVLVLYGRNDEGVSGKSKQYHWRARSMDPVYSLYLTDKANGNECELFRKPYNYREVLRNQKISTFPLKPNSTARLCISLNTSCAIVRDTNTGLWSFRCLPVLTCGRIEFLYVRVGTQVVLRRLASQIGDLLHLLSKQDIELLGVYGECSGVYHGTVLFNTCVKFHISDGGPSLFRKFHLGRVHGQSSTKQSKVLDIQVIYLHFISRQQFIEWLPETFQLILSTSKSKPDTVFDFEKYQSLYSTDSSYLRTFLYGPQNENNPESSDSLLRTAHRQGYKSTLFDLTCRSSDNRTTILDDLHCVECKDTLLYQSAISDLCSSDRFLKIQSPVIDMALLGNSKHNTPSFRVSFISLADIKAEQDLAILDLMLSQALRTRLGVARTATVILSDVGYMFTLPSPLTAFDHSHLSNAVLFIALAEGKRGSFVPNKARIRLKENQGELISIINIHSSVLWLLMLGAYPVNQSRSATFMANNETRPMSRLLTDSLFGTLSVNRACRSLKVSAPNMCICQNQQVEFRNDTVQVAFVEFITGWVNKKRYKHYAVGGLSKRLFYQGMKFFNPRLSTHGGSTVFSAIIVMGEYETYPQHRFHGCVAMEAVLKWNCSHERTCQVTSICHAYIDSQAVSVKTAVDSCKIALQNHFYQIPDEFSRLINIRTAFLKHFGVKQQHSDIFEGCVFLMITDFVKSVSFSVLNVCSGQRVSVQINLILKDMLSLRPTPVVEEDIQPTEVRFLTTIVQTSYFASRRVVRYTTHVTKQGSTLLRIHH